MAVRRDCDRCGKEIGPSMIPKQLIRTGLFDKRYDLCYDCYEEFDEWIKEDYHEPKTENEENETGAGVV